MFLLDIYIISQKVQRKLQHKNFSYIKIIENKRFKVINMFVPRKKETIIFQQIKPFKNGSTYYIFDK